MSFFDRMERGLWLKLINEGLREDHLLAIKVVH